MAFLVYLVLKGKTPVHTARHGVWLVSRDFEHRMVSFGMGKNTVHPVNSTVVEIEHAHTQLESVVGSVVKSATMFYLASSQLDTNNACCDNTNDNDASVVKSVVDFTETRRIECNASYAGRRGGRI